MISGFQNKVLHSDTEFHVKLEVEEMSFPKKYLRSILLNLIRVSCSTWAVVYEKNSLSGYMSLPFFDFVPYSLSILTICLFQIP